MKKSLHPARGRLFTHPFCHLARAERLHYLLLTLKGSFANLRKTVENELKDFHLLNSACIYPLFGQSDVLIRIWSPPTVIKELCDEFSKSSYVADISVFLIGEMETWYQRKMEESRSFPRCIPSDFVDAIINNPKSISSVESIVKNPKAAVSDFQRKVSSSEPKIHLYIFFDGSMAINEDIFSQMKDKISRHAKAIRRDSITAISLYSYYRQDRRGVLLKAEVANFERKAKAVAFWASQLKPTGGKTLTMVCQTIENTQGDDFWPPDLESLRGGRNGSLTREAKQRLNWVKGRKCNNWSEAFARSILETQEFDDEFLQFYESVDPDSATMTTRFREIVQKHAARIVETYQARLVDKFNENWWKFLFDLRKLLKWTATKSDSRTRDFFMTKYVMFEKVLRQTIEPIYPEIAEAIHKEREEIYKKKIVRDFLLNECDKIHKANASATTTEDYYAAFRQKFSAVLEKSDKSSLVNRIEGIDSPFSETSDVTLGGISHRVIPMVISILKQRRPDYNTVVLEELKTALKMCSDYRNRFMHGLIDNYFVTDEWAKVLDHYIEFRLSFPEYLHTMQSAVDVIRRRPESS